MVQVRKLALLWALLAASAFAQTTNNNIIPSSTGLSLGRSNQRWNLFAQNVNITGSCTLNGHNCFGATIPLFALNNISILDNLSVNFVDTAMCTWTNPSGGNVSVSCSGAGGIPGGSDKQLQTNNAAAFGGITNAAVGSVLASQGTSSFPVFQTKTVIDMRDYAFGKSPLCDGSNHALSGFYGSLAAAQAVYPFITSLSQTLDYATIKAAANAAFGSDGSEHGTNTALNKPLLLPAGTCRFGADTLLIRNADGIKIEGAGKTATILQANGIVLGFDGLWYSQLSDFQVQTTGAAATAALDIDGNVPGHPYPTRGVQGNLIQNLLVVGGGATTGQYALAWCRLGNNNAQCSENTMINLHVSQAITPFYIIGFNALDNVWVGGDVQGFKGPGVYNYQASLDLIKISFEGGRGCQQITDNTYDVDGTAGGVGGSIRIVGGRSEDYQFFNGNAAAPGVISGVSTNPGVLTWSAGLPVTLNQGTFQTATDGHKYLYCVTTAGTTGGVAPTWPTSGTVSDGGAVWTQTTYITANLPAGRFDFASNHYDPSGKVLVNQFEMGGDIRSNFGLGQYNYVLNSTGSLSEMYLSNGSIPAGVYANGTGTPQTSLKTGAVYPASSAGLLTNLYDTQIGNTRAWTIWSHGVPDIEFKVLGAPGNTAATMGASAMSLTIPLTFTADNTLDIGAAGATRPRTGYFGTSVVSPIVNAATGFRVNNAAPLNHCLVGDGTNYIDSATCGVVNPVTGTGTTNKVSKFTGASAIGDSSITDDGSTVSTTEAFSAASISSTDATVFGATASYTSAVCETAGAPTTLSTVATTTDTGLSCLPANSTIDKVEARVTTTITGACTGWSLGDAATAGRFASNNTTLTAGTTTDAAHIGTFNNTGIASATTGIWQASAASVRITCAGGNPAAGAIRVIVFYHVSTPPTS